MKTKETILHTVVDGTASFDSGLQATGMAVDAGSPVSPNAGEHVATEKCRVAIDVTGFAGTNMIVTIVAMIAGIEHIIGTFTTITGVTSEVIDIADCPSSVKVKGVASSVTDFDAVVTANRLV